MSTYMETLGKKAKQASVKAKRLSIQDKNDALEYVAQALIQHIPAILEENQKDVAHAKERGVSLPLIDRLELNENRIYAMADGLRQIIQLDDPIGEVLSMKTRPNGLKIGKQRVSLGVVGIIYESRPNVTADAFGLCFKTSNAVILRGGSDAIHSNKKIVTVIREGLSLAAVCEDMIQLVEDTSREVATEMMQLREYIDVLIPRGGQALIDNVVKNSTIPSIETGTGNCHVYIDRDASLDMAVKIIVNAKTTRMGVCNSCESLVVHRSVISSILPYVLEELLKHDIEIRGDQEVQDLCTLVKEATEEDWGREYLDAIISVKVVDSIEDAITHINTYNTGHSDAIVTENYKHAMMFLDEVDAAAVYVNASTRFTDGEVFGLGAEIGISTQKLHARGPMGLEALTTTKFIIFGDGQVR